MSNQQETTRMKQLRYPTLALAALALALTACSGNGSSSDAGATAPAATAQSADQQLNTLVEEYWDKYLELNPLQATLNGDYRFNNRLENDISPAYIADSRALESEYLKKLGDIKSDQLSAQSRITYDIFRRDRTENIEGFTYQSELLPVSQFFNRMSLFAQLSSTGLHPFRNVKDYDDWLSRVHDYVAWVDQSIVNMRSGVNKDIVQPRILMERVLPQLAALNGGDPKESVYYRGVAAMPPGISSADRARLEEAFQKAIKEEIWPANERLLAYIRDEYLPKTRATVGMNALPMGDTWYAYLARRWTTTDKTPDEIHRIGLAEVARIHGEMEKIIAEVGFKGDFKAFLEMLRSDPRFYYSKPEEAIDGYRALKERASLAAQQIFSVAPKADFEIRPVEAFREKSASSAAYQPATEDGSRPGIFYVNTYDLKSRPRYQMQSIFLHEAIPGHHFQLSIQQEVGSLPRFRRFGGYGAYVEGWGLYAESLGYEMGFYTDPYDHFGALSAEIWRAARLVLDTGLHSKGWTREQAIDYLTSNTAIGPSDAVAEVERYIAIPGQALSYKIGELKFKELRARAQKALGPRFDLKEFHRQVLIDGALPLDVLDAKIDRWIASQPKS
jgi:uncharacterized protein (DUF885 family)